MKKILRLFSLLLAGIFLFLGLETVLPQYPSFLSKSTAVIFLFVGILFSYYALTGHSSIISKRRKKSEKGDGGI